MWGFEKGNEQMQFGVRVGVACWSQEIKGLVMAGGHTFQTLMRTGPFQALVFPCIPLAQFSVTFPFSVGAQMP